MGIDVYAEAGVESEQDILEKELIDQGLNLNLRLCGIREWKYIFRLFTGICVDRELKWTTLSGDQVQKWVNTATLERKNIFGSSSFDENVDKLYKYMNICVKYNAGLWIC